MNLYKVTKYGSFCTDLAVRPLKFQKNYYSGMDVKKITHMHKPVGN